MKLVAYVEEGFKLDIRPARPERAWLDKFQGGYAYGCLPMIIANQHGWEILSPIGFTAVWNGGEHRDCLAILPDESTNDRIVSHFGSGIFSYSLPAVFRTEPGFDLVLQGPPNTPIDGATPLSGTVETDWLLSSVAMHWQLTQPNKAVRFRKGDPICQIFPLRRGELETFEPELRVLSDDPDVSDYMDDWLEHRQKFNKALKDPNSSEFRQKWPGHYRRGSDIYGNEVAPGSHRTRQRLAPFDDKRPQKDKAI